MDDFDFIEQKPKRRFRLGEAFFNLLTLGVVLATLAATAYFILVFLYPNSAINMLPPVQEVAEATLAQPTTTIEIIPATEEPTATATATEAVIPSETPLSPTATSLPGTATPTETHEPGSYYGIQDGTPLYSDFSAFHPEIGCNSMVVAGLPFALDDSTVPGLFVEISGTLDGVNIEKTGLTGAVTYYGDGAYYEIRLADEPIESDGTLSIVLLDEEGNPISDSTSFNTSSSCEENLILINFKALP